MRPLFRFVLAYLLGTAPVAQGIEHRPPEAGAEVRILAGAPILQYRRSRPSLRGSCLSLKSVSPIASIKRLAWGAILLVLFLATRLLNTWLWQIPSVTFVQNDVSYYGFWLWCLFGDGAADERCTAALAGPGIMTEYPLPAVWFLEVLYTLGSGTPPWVPWVILGVLITAAYVALSLWRFRIRLAVLGLGSALGLSILLWFCAALPMRSTAFATWLPVFALTMLLLDATVAFLLFRHGTVSATLFWIVFIGACGPIVWFRFDILTAAAVAIACLWLVRYPFVSGALIGIGASVKLWPALLIAPMAAPNPRARGNKRLIGFLVTGLSLGLLSLLIGGWARSMSPIEWQSHRGLQMESVPATPLLFLRAFTHEGAWEVKLSEYNAIELFGPGASTLLTVSTLLTAGSLILTAILTWRLFKNRNAPEQQTEAILLVVLAVVLATIIANKTLSTQYVQWLAGPFAALLALAPSEAMRRARRLLAVGLVIVAVLTQYTYPWGTHGIMALPYASGFETSTLIARNLLLVLLTGFTAGLAWRASAPRNPASTGEVR